MDRKFIKAVGALHSKEVESILIWSDDAQVCLPVDLQIMKKFPEKFFYKDDENIMKAIKEESSEGPFQFIVLIFR